MCAISGVVHWQCSDPTEARVHVEGMVKHQRHRGPDAEAVVALDDAVLGHNRLAIIDLSEEANQPMSDSSGRYWLVYNGEVYNYRELRPQLEDAGWSFRTQSDTEVVLAALITWGPDAVTRFNGMWALALLDTEDRSLLLSRDRFGEKPLVYCQQGGRLVFASEANALVALDPRLGVPDDEAVALFMRHNLVADGTRSFYRDIKRLPPAHSMLVTPTGSRTWAHWQPPTPFESHELPTRDEAADTFLSLLTDSVRLRLRSDVPVATTLSGGIDSSSIATLVRSSGIEQHTTYTASFPDEPFDEADVATCLAEELGFTSKVVPDQIHRLEPTTLDAIVRHMDGPTCNPATVPLWSLMTAIQGDRTKVVLDGQGADELLGGYTGQVAPYLVAGLLRGGHPITAARQWGLFAKGFGVQYAAAWTVRTQLPSTHELFRRVVGLESLLGPSLRKIESPVPALNLPSGLDATNAVLAQQQVLLLRTLLDYGDKISMAHGVEVRMPYTDHRLVDFVLRLPGSYKVMDGTGKLLQRRALADVLPPEVFQRPKLGFVTPVGHWFRRSQASQWLDLLTNGEAVAQGYLDTRGVEHVLETPSRSRDIALFKAVTLELWFRQLAHRKVPAF